MANTRTRQMRADTHAAYGLAGYAVVAAHFGVRFGMLSLARPFALARPRLPERAHLLAILYASHTAEAAHTSNRHRPMVAEQSPHFLTLREALARDIGAMDALDVRQARLTGTAIVKRPGNWAAVGALAERLAAGETLGYLTARRVIRPVSAPRSSMSVSGERHIQT